MNRKKKREEEEEQGDKHKCKKERSTDFSDRQNIYYRQ